MRSLRPPAPPSPAQRRVRRYQVGGGWFYWVAVLTVLAALGAAAGRPWSFYLDLRAPAWLGGLLAPGSAVGVSLALAVALGLVFAGLGWQARRGQAWAFWAGLALYLADAAVCVLVADWLSLLVHLVGLGGMAAGLWALLHPAEPR